MYSHRIVQLLAALFLLLQLGSCAAISRREPTTPSNPSTGTKRPGTSSGGENPEDNKKPKPDEGTTPADTTPAVQPAPKISLDEWKRTYLPMTKSSNSEGGAVWSKFVRQAHRMQHRKRIRSSNNQLRPQQVLQELALATLAVNVWPLSEGVFYGWKRNRPPKWQYKKLTAGGGGTFEWKAKGMMVSLTFAPDIGFGLGTIPGDALTESRAPVLFKVLGKERMHAEDRSYEEIEKEAKFPATTTQYPQGTINEQTGNKKWS
ncbi:hypothetical protein DL95DRAFT_415062 [Leptodontidium sp. 2 PMI_412]|nr:hypothetical protein DL95DRAFT_415062 [Leptodontidium sp. 2 PMI_412]